MIGLYRNAPPRIRKDLRALVLPFAVMILAGPAILMLAEWRSSSAGWDEWGGMTFVQFIAFNLLCASLFGHEYGDDTMRLLLSQPVERRTIWNEKISLVAIMLVACLTWNVILRFTVFIRLDSTHWSDGPAGQALLALTALTTAPLLSLKAKTTVAGTLASMSFPYVTLLLFAYLRYWLISDPRTSFNPLGPFEITGAMIWWCVTFWLGRRAYLRLEV